MHDDPLPIYVPCHRVIASGGKIGGYGGGIQRKLQLLRSESFALAKRECTFPTTLSGATWEAKIYCRVNRPTAGARRWGAHSCFSPTLERQTSRHAAVQNLSAGSEIAIETATRRDVKHPKMGDRDGIEVKLPFKYPYDWPTIIRFYQSHPIPGLNGLRQTPSNECFTSPAKLELFASKRWSACHS